jgi:anti-sigma factor RsiW
MDIDTQLKLQAFLDGELPESEAREVANWVARDKEATALLGELRNTRQALAGAEAVMTLRESREFFWSKVRREIERQDGQRPLAGVRKPSLLAQWRRFIVSAGAAAAVIIVALIAVGPAAVPESEASMADPGAFTYRDYKAQATLVWLSYPAENEIADGDAADILQ